MAISQSFSTTRPSLNLNFARAKTLDPRVGFTRASTGTYIDSDGLVKTAQVDTARFTYDPATGESLGLLVEESRTNLWVNSISIVSSNPPVYGNWNQASTTANTAVAPDGTTTADTITPGSPSASVIQRFLATAGTTYTFSIYVKRNPGSDNTYLDRFGFVVSWSNNGSTLAGNATFELVPGSSATNVLTDQWKRFSFSYTCPAGAISMEMGISNRNSGTGSPGYSVLAWGAQVEAGSYATSYIPTSGSTVTRQADKPILLGSAITPLGRSFAPSGLISIGTENSTIASSGGGSVVFDGDADYLDLAASADFALGTGDFTIEGWVNTTFFNLDGPNNRRIYMTDGPTGNANGNLQIILDTSNQGGLYAWSNNGDLTLITTGSLANGKWNHFAICRSGTTLTAFVNGINVGSTTYATNITANGGSPRPRIGSYTGASGNGDLSGYISNLRVVKGTALYTSNFTPIAPLKVVNGTVLLCCNSPTSATFEATGKTLTANGNASPSTQAPVSLAFDAQASDTNTISNVLYYPVPLASATVASMRNAYVPIVKDDLVLHLDAGYNKSYSGSGTTWYDLSGKGNNGTLVNGIGYSSANGGALNFDGANDRISIINTIPSLSNFTIELFMKTSTLDGSQDIFFDQLSSLRFEIINNKYRTHLGDGTTWAFTDHVGSTTLSLNTWYQTVWTWNGSSSILYLNGLQDSLRTHSSFSSGTGTITLGQHTPDTNYNWNGNIGVLKLYNRALTATEVIQNFNALRNRFRI